MKANDRIEALGQIAETHRRIPQCCVLVGQAEQLATALLQIFLCSWHRDTPPRKSCADPTLAAEHAASGMPRPCERAASSSSQKVTRMTKLKKRIAPADATAVVTLPKFVFVGSVIGLL